MILAVLDTSVFVAAIGWRGAAYRVVVTREILDEYEVTARRVEQERGCKKLKWSPPADARGHPPSEKSQSGKQVVENRRYVQRRMSLTQ